MEWSESDLVSYIQGRVPEGTTLDYKRSAALHPFGNDQKKELVKDVSAFANSEGGILIYGIAEEKVDGVPMPTDFDDGLPPVAITAEQMEQVLLSRMHPRIDGLKTHFVPLNIARPGKISVVIEVPQSSTAHQAPDHVYYKRYQYMNQPMEDYEVRDVMNRVKTAQVDVKVWCEKNSDASMQIFVQAFNVGIKAVRDITLEISARNHKVFSYVDGKYTPRVLQSQPTGRGFLLTISGILHPSQELMLISPGTNPMALHYQERFYDEEVIWTVYADDMSPKTGVILMSDYIHRTRELNTFTGEILP